MFVNEIFGPTIQGEGRSAGMPTMFLRTALCNLACIWCDTQYTWNWKKYSQKDEIHTMSCDEIVSILKEKGPEVRSLVISGGEPMIQQAAIIELLILLKKDNYRIEIETNGTVFPNNQFLDLIDQINCSPKTSNSGNQNREWPHALKKLAEHDKTFFKFVIQSQEDLPEVKDLIARYKMKNIYLMAEGETRERQVELSQMISEMCSENNFNLSPRLHVLYWNGERGR